MSIITNFVPVSPCLAKHHAMKTNSILNQTSSYGYVLGMEVQLHAFLTSALNGGEWSTSHPGRFTPGEIVSCNHCTGGWVETIIIFSPYSMKKEPG
jgi:hypothetical protein